jgi:hypothetical protein
MRVCRGSRMLSFCSPAGLPLKYHLNVVDADRGNTLTGQVAYLFFASMVSIEQHHRMATP